MYTPTLTLLYSAIGLHVTFYGSSAIARTAILELKEKDLKLVGDGHSHASLRY